ncbi:MAG TPA: hypothetical protein ACFYEK_17470, partial [Candidatus Wunengus sp. YC60]|uniref:hypothetical protein n=1 Tax=Candidatus Wunengus sp. YC60 TaxID=3367697 RepID=UPI004026B9B6
ARLPVKKKVVGSNPTGGANIKNGALGSFFYMYFSGGTNRWFAIQRLTSEFVFTSLSAGE